MAFGGECPCLEPPPGGDHLDRLLSPSDSSFKPGSRRLRAEPILSAKWVVVPSNSSRDSPTEISTVGDLSSSLLLAVTWSLSPPGTLAKPNPGLVDHSHLPQRDARLGPNSHNMAAPAAGVMQVHHGLASRFLEESLATRMTQSHALMLRFAPPNYLNRVGQQ